MLGTADQSKRELNQSISISNLKRDFSRRFPSHPLTRILLNEPDTMHIEELIAKAGTWLAFFQAEKSVRK